MLQEEQGEQGVRGEQGEQGEVPHAALPRVRLLSVQEVVSLLDEERCMVVDVHILERDIKGRVACITGAIPVGV